MINFKNAVILSHIYMKLFIDSEKFQVIVDATCGNGYDSEFMAELKSESSVLYCVDIQQEAINNTAARLKRFKNINFIRASHENLGDILGEKPDLCVYNLGYLPGGNKEICTEANVTVNSVRGLLNKLNCEGAAIIVSYTGHEKGREEYDKLSLFLAQLDQKVFNVFETKFLNQVNNPASLFVIQKIVT